MSIAVPEFLSPAYPNFIYIGPDKAGSTWLYRILKKHSQVFLPDAKELFYFDKYYHKGPEWYLKQFSTASSAHVVVGEISHDYLFSTDACRRIAKDLPHAKLMVCLREPVDRAFSSYLYMVRQGRVKESFETALQHVEELVDHGRYAKHLSHYLEQFSREQIYVGIFDDLKSDPLGFMNGIYEFLGIDNFELPEELTKKVLPAAKPRSFWLARFAKQTALCIRAIGLPAVVSRIKESPMVSRMLYSPYTEETKPAISNETRNELRNLFYPEVRRLDELMESDLLYRWGYQ
ncbi:sulfotransferase [Nitrosococcus halophilus Nc 4]|uniref:Sulfotransferase n=1 Tax=Nitrosococcus halophilus (strain Nc4) TaxID=472759 RepID=D5C0F6_NITHN|nr:sulfotransferase [Nitrosococcus halophilus]ADE14482.1 sulfotransferase [Nitrosococcus halophilus Nc 4]